MKHLDKDIYITLNTHIILTHIYIIRLELLTKHNFKNFQTLAFCFL